eukprot:158499_1
MNKEQLFLEMAEKYTAAALNYLNIINSPHLLTILLEVKSDMNGMSALDMSLEYELKTFLTNPLVDRITTSMMIDWQFLTPMNTEMAFQINTLSMQLIWKKLWHSYSVFYFTPLGYFVTTVFLYIVYLILFTILSLTKFRVFDPMTEGEIVFWILNMGYILHEIVQLCAGFHEYFSTTSNYFDAVISTVFLFNISIRIYSLHKG